MMNNFCKYESSNYKNLVNSKAIEKLLCISDVIILPLISIIIIFVFMRNEWKFYRNKVSREYEAPLFVRTLALISCSLNLLSPIFEVISRLYIFENDEGYSFFIKIGSYLLLSLLLLTSCENFSLLVNWNYSHIFMWILFMLYFIIETAQVSIEFGWNILAFIHLSFKLPFIFTYVWTFWKIHRSLYRRSPSTVPSRSSKYVAKRSEMRNIYALISYIFLSWGTHIFTSKCDITNIQNLIPLPKGIVIKYVEEKFNRLMPWSRYKYSPFRLLMKAYGWKYFLLGFLCFISDILIYLQPIALENIINFFTKNSQYDLAFGLTWMSVLIFSCSISSLTKIHFDYQLGSLILSVKSAFLMMIYKNILFSRLYKRNYVASGNLFNLVSTDLDQFVNFGCSFHSSWSIGFQFSIALYLLYRQLGFSFMIGIAFSLLMVPINYLIGLRIQKCSQGLLRNKDARLKIILEIFVGILPIKVNNWIMPFSKIVREIRKKEISYLRSSKYLDAFCVIFWATSPSIVATLTLGLYVLLGNELTATQAYTSISIFFLLNAPINILSCSINGMMQAILSARRLGSFFEQIHVEESDVIRFNNVEEIILSEKELIMLKNASFCYNCTDCNIDRQYNTVLKDISVSIKEKQLIAVVGVVASGKSTFLLSILQECHQCNGTVRRRDSLRISYCPQNPWLFRGTIRENILRGSTYTESRYNRILEVCSLAYDLKNLPDGDLTNIGPRGIILSGGQKARISLAATVYKKADVYLLDDILSAVDVDVADDIFNNCILGFLRNKTRIIAINQLKYLDKFSNIFELHDFKLTEKTLDTLTLYLDTVSSTPDTNTQCLPTRHNSFSLINLGSSEGSDELTFCKEKSIFLGYVSFSTYINYLKLFGKLSILVLLVSITLFTTSRCISDWWINYWVNDLSKSASVVGPFPVGLTINNYCLIIYSEITGFCIVFAVFRAFSFAYGALCASCHIHEKLLKLYLLLPLRFYEENDIGTLLNNFSADIFAVDDTIPFVFNIFLAGLFNLLGTITAICVTIPVFVPIIFVFIPIIIYMQHIYRRTTNVLKRLNTNSLSPILDSITECYEGSICIKTSECTKWFIHRYKKCVSDLLVTSYSLLYGGLWFRLVLQIISVALQLLVLISSVLTFYYLNINKDVLCLGITYSLMISSSLLSLLQSFVETDKNMVHAERVFQRLEQLEFQYLDKTKLDDNSESEISQGEIIFNNVKLIYPNGKVIFPDGLCIKIYRGTKIGICGPTGCGKSSIMKLLFKVILPSSGEILIDGKNLMTISNDVMARSFLLVTQEAIIFSQTLRFNLDPGDEFADDQLWDVLQRTGLKPLFKNKGLNTIMNGEDISLSAGQKQMLILSRGLLRKPKVICFDEATSNLDFKTEENILKLVEETFKESTIISIAHRVECIVDTDFVFVLDDGKIIESGATKLLLQNEESFFKQLLDKQKIRQ